MTEKFEIDPAAFRAAAGKTRQVGTRVAGVWSTLESATAGRGAPWGDDKLGKQFADGADGQPGYLASKKNMRDFAVGEGGNGGMSGAFNGLADSQAKVADDIQTKLEEPNRRGFEYR
ncbi:hypothetical protein DFR70_103342 [Nocardia tenerifensis]|uniref:Excreted virulence factor EspC (Type VII ESX diderm) n=1 Tax=Nocardia tenerifensis TaxID=228006 RepID=A0A318KHI5_9NOCA|nr:hypothetical protein [Nocardia tenerifensis]PXX66593.1 hypothetical protein DFR70_103342 [Nocardia tenerifensis]